MSSQCEVTAKKAAGSPMGFFERYLSVWVFLFVGRLEVAQINFSVMLAAVGVVNRTRVWYERRDGVVP